MSTDWGGLSTAARVGRETTEALTIASNDSVEVANSALRPRLGIRACAFVDSRWGRRVTGCLDFVWSIPLSTNWVGWPTADCMGRETSEVSTNDAVEELENDVLPPMLGMFGFEYSEPSRHVTVSLDVTWSTLLSAD